MEEEREETNLGEVCEEREFELGVSESDEAIEIVGWEVVEYCIDEIHRAVLEFWFETEECDTDSSRICKD